MNRLALTFISASAMIFGLILPRDEAVAQTANGLVETWTLLSVTLEKNGMAVDFYGPNPTGQVIFDAGGHFSFMLAHAARKIGRALESAKFKFIAHGFSSLI
jgi:hypothetical protein